MLTIPLSLRRTRVVKAAHIWFAAKPRPGDALKLAYYYHCKFTGPVRGFERQAKFTTLVDITRPPEAILEGFHKNTAYKVRRALKDGLQFGVLDQPEAFISFYNDFSAAKGRAAMDERQTRAYWPHLVVTQIKLGDEVLVMHSTLLDKEAGRALMYTSASQFRGLEDSAKRNLIGRANRLLHYQDMLWAREHGFKVYDFGGYAANTTDADLARINEFKDGFAGELVEESNYASASLGLLRKIKSFLTPAAPPEPPRASNDGPANQAD